MRRRSEGLVEADNGSSTDPWNWFYQHYLLEVPITAATTLNGSKESYDAIGWLQSQCHQIFCFKGKEKTSLILPLWPTQEFPWRSWTIPLRIEKLTEKGVIDLGLSVAETRNRTSHTEAGQQICSHSRWPVIYQFRRREVGRITQRPGWRICSHSRWPVIHLGIWWQEFPAPEVCGGRWEYGTVPGVMSTSLKNVNSVLADEAKTVYSNIDININRKIRRGQINQPFKILILFIK